MTINNLIDSIDRREAQNDEVEFAAKGAALVHQFSSRDWLALRGLNLKTRSNLWIECLIDILDRARTAEARQAIVYIALAGTEEIFFKAMACIRRFRKDVSIYTWLKLENRATEISSCRLKNQSDRSNDY